jgi:hypothetical protein
MRYLPLVCLLVASSPVWQQERTPASANLPDQSHAATPPGEEDEQPPLPESASKVAPDAAVITIQGICAPPLSSPSENSHPECQTQISRTQFEGLADAVLTNKKPSNQRELARGYPSLLAMAQAAEALGLENSPRFQQRMAYARLQMLSHELVRKIEQDSANIPQKEIEEYYLNHSAEFREATLERIYIPNRKRDVAPAGKKATSEAQRASSEAEMNQVAEKLRERAAAGESFLLLQKEAYTAAGLTDVPPNPSLGQLSPNGLPPSHAFAFDLKADEVSQVFRDATGHYIYKLDSKRLEPSQETHQEIVRILRLERRDKALRAIQQPITSELNPAYFGPADKHMGTSDAESK